MENNYNPQNNPQYTNPQQYADPQYANPQQQYYADPQQQYANPQYANPQYYAPQNAVAMQPPMPMKWFKFIIYFSLFASAVLNVITGITTLTGAQYQGVKNMVYLYFKDLKTADTLYGVVLLGLAAFAIFARFRLSGYRKNGPAMLNVVYIANSASALIYSIIAQAIVNNTPLGAGIELDLTSAIASIVTSIVMVVINTIYFKKRAHLFVN